MMMLILERKILLPVVDYDDAVIMIIMTFLIQVRDPLHPEID